MHSYLVHYQEQCLPTRLSQNIVRSSTINRRPNKNLKYGEKFQISLEIPREFLSGNWQYRGNLLRYLLHLYFVLCYILSSSSGNKKKLEVPPGKKVGNVDLECGVYSVIHQVKEPLSPSPS